ncbi:sugar phosphate nucleotidyltransferase [Paracoccaceae bacterium]|nr:sugar phosphate nucleotidyltransferase [Paracoccaceae bacterium]
MLADDFLTFKCSGVTSDLVRAYEKSNKTQLSVMQIDGSVISKYGVVKLNRNKGFVDGLVEKPEFNDASSNLASIGRYVLRPDIFDILRNQSNGIGNEIQLADAINTQAKVGNVKYLIHNGQRFDCGSVRGYVDAISYIAKRDGIS